MCPLPGIESPDIESPDIEIPDRESHEAEFVFCKMIK